MIFASCRQLDDAVRVGIKLLHGQGDRIDLLDELGSQVAAYGGAPGPGDEDPHGSGGNVGKARADRALHVQARLRSPRLVAPVVLQEHAVAGGIHHDELRRGAAHVQPQEQSLWVLRRGQEGGHRKARPSARIRAATSRTKFAARPTTPG
jgi:hypothetical protein